MRIRAATLLLCLVSILGGCGYKDIDKRFFVVAVGVDQSDSNRAKYKVTFKIAIPPEKPSAGTSESAILSEEAETITEAVRMIRAQVDKELDFSHTKVIIFGKSLAQQDVAESLDWFIRRRDIQGIAYMAIGSPSAKEVLLVEPKYERLSGNSLFLYFGRTGTESSYVITVYLYDFYRRLNERGIDPILPIVEAQENRYSIQSSAVFKGGRMKQTLNHKESEIINAFMDNVEKSDIGIEKNGRDFNVFADSVKLDYKLIDGSKPSIFIHCKMNVSIEESKQMIKEREIGDLERLIEEMIEQAVLKLVRKLQQEGVDPVGFGIRYRASHFNNSGEEWREWQKLYPKIDFKVQAKVDIRGTGSIF